jgi:hypothetical protein
VRGTTVLLLTGGWGESHLEQALEGAHRAAARDLLETLSATETVERIIVATDDPEWGETLADLPVMLDMDQPGQQFHFGRRLTALIERYDVQRALYTGGGSAPLLPAEQWAAVVGHLDRAERLVVTNNVHSCDWAAFTSAQEAVSLIAELPNDNGIAWSLANDGGFRVRTLQAAAGSRFDIDTPVDLLIAQRCPKIGRHLRSYLSDLGWESPQLDGVVAEMRREGGSLIVAGRVSPDAWAVLQRETRCWVRVFAEERGMRATGRQRRGEVQSLLSSYLDLVGCEGFFESLAGLAQGVLLDNRVILASQRLWPSALDRFNSDLYRWCEIQEPFLRALTREASEADVPVVMGGHTVVAGGLMALAETIHSDGARWEEESEQ